MAKKEIIEEAIEETDPKEKARAYIEEAIIKINWTHIEKWAIRPIVEQVLSFF